MSAVTPEAREQAIGLVVATIRQLNEEIPVKYEVSRAMNIVQAFVAAGWSPPVTPEATRLCPNGCGCRYGTNDADRTECACDGPCCFDQNFTAPEGGKP